jgi:hypothetical protein
MKQSRRNLVTGRTAPSDPEQRQRRTSIGGQFAPRLIEMLESPAYRVLSLGAHRVIARIEIELGHHGGTNNGKLPVTYDQLEEYGMDRQTIGPAIREAHALGFITVIGGRAGNAEFRTPSLYGLTYNHRNNPTHEWRRIKTLEEACAIRAAARRPDPASPARIRALMKTDLASRQSASRANLSTRIKNSFPVGKNPTPQGGKPPPKTKIPSGENPHYSHRGETPTTSISPLPSSLPSFSYLSEGGDIEQATSEGGRAAARGGEAPTTKLTKQKATKQTARGGGRARILAALRGKPAGLHIAEITTAAGIANRAYTDVLLHGMRRDGLVERIAWGLYGLPRSSTPSVASTALTQE